MKRQKNVLAGIITLIMLLSFNSLFSQKFEKHVKTIVMLETEEIQNKTGDKGTGSKTFSNFDIHGVDDNSEIMFLFSDNNFAPENSTVTSVQYYIRVDDRGTNSTFRCDDYEIYLVSTTTWGSWKYDDIVWDNQGDWLDDNKDDDSSNDSDVHLDKTSHYFDGEKANQYWGIIIKDTKGNGKYGQKEDLILTVNYRTYPDLVSNITNLTVSGTQVSIDASVTNNGAGNAGSSHLAYYLSANTTISTGDYRIGDDYVGSLSAGSSSNESITVDVTTITPAVPPGTYYIGCIADYTNEEDESNENNNTDYETSPKVTVTIPQGQVDVVARVVWDNTVGKNEIVNGGVVTQAKNYINDQFSWINFTLDFTSGTTAEWITPSGSPTWVDMINDLMDDFSHTSEQHTIIGLSKKPYEGTGNAGVESQDYAFIDFYPNTQGYNTDEMTIVSIIMHEWGHSLGIRVHCCDIENCVMNTQGVHNRNHAFCSSCKHIIAIHLAGEDFDDGTHNWTLNGLWHVTSYRENSANNSLAYNQESSHDYNTGVANSGTATFDVTLPSSPVLEFDHYRVVESYPSPYDVARVEISTDGGSTWGTLQQWDSRNPTNPWEHVSISLNGYTGNVKIRFYFNTIDRLYNNYEGWYIDDVVVKSNSGKSGPAKLVEATQGDPRGDVVVFSYPNPFTGSTTINYILNEQENVSLKVYNITGQLVATLVNKQKPAGQHTIQWNANDTYGNKIPNGTYFIRMQTKDNTQTTKLVLMR